MLRAAIFDMDGVLVDSHPIHMRAWRRFFNSVDKCIDDKGMAFILEGQKKEDILRHFLGELPEEQKKAFGRQKEILFQEEATRIETIPGVRGFLDQFAEESIALGVASCGSSGRVHYLLDLLDLRDYFQVVVTGDDVRLSKPDPAIFQAAAAELTIGAEEILVVEDSISGVQAAKAARMKCLGIAAPARAQSLLRVGADRVVSDFVDASLVQMKELFS
jgi:beta-phosphoglucomutase